MSEDTWPPTDDTWPDPDLLADVGDRCPTCGGIGGPRMTVDGPCTDPIHGDTS